MPTALYLQNLKVKDYCVDTAIDGKITLQFIIVKWGVKWIHLPYG